MQLPSVPFPGAAVGRGLGAPAVPDLKTESAERRFSGAAEDFEAAGSQEDTSGGDWNSSSSRRGRQDGAIEAAPVDSAESRAVQTLGMQAAAVEGIYRAMLARIEALAPELTADLAALGEQKKAVAELQDMIR